MTDIEWDWFEESDEAELDSPDHALTSNQRTFLAALREHARGWPCQPDNTQLVEPGDGCDQWRALLDVPHPSENRVVITVGVCFEDDRIEAAYLDSCSCLPKRGRGRGFKAHGTPEELARVAAEWFEDFLARRHLRI